MNRDTRAYIDLIKAAHDNSADMPQHEQLRIADILVSETLDFFRPILDRTSRDVRKGSEDWSTSFTPAEFYEMTLLFNALDNFRRRDEPRSGR